jgi:hypothetical protein
MAINVRNFAYKYLFSYLCGSVTCRKILRHGTNSFTSPLKEVVLRICVALKNPSSSAGFEPSKRGSSGKHDSHYTAENDLEMT